MSVKLSNYAYQPPKSNVAVLKAGDISNVAQGVAVYVISLDAFFEWNPSSTATPNDLTVICPNSITPPDPGRWILIGDSPKIQTESGNSRILNIGDIGTLINFTSDGDLSGIVSITVNLNITSEIGAQIFLLYTGKGYAELNQNPIPGVVITGITQFAANQQITLTQIAINTWVALTSNPNEVWEYVNGYTADSAFAVGDVVYASSEQIFAGMTMFPTISKMTSIEEQSPMGVIAVNAGTNETAKILKRGIMSYDFGEEVSPGDLLYVDATTFQISTHPSYFQIGRVLVNLVGTVYNVYIDVNQQTVYTSNQEATDGDLAQGWRNGIPTKFLLNDAASKATTNPAQAVVASVITPFVSGNFIKAADTAGTNQDSGKNSASFKTNGGAAQVALAGASDYQLTNPMPSTIFVTGAASDFTIKLGQLDSGQYNQGDNIVIANDNNWIMTVQAYAGSTTWCTVPAFGGTVLNLTNVSTAEGNIVPFVSNSISGAFGQAAYKDVTDNSVPSVVSLESFTSGNLVIFNPNGSATDSGIAAADLMTKPTETTNQLFQIFSPLTNAAMYSPTATMSNGAVYPAFIFQNGVDSEIHGQIELPDNYSISNTFEIELYWFGTSGTVTDDVKFKIDAFIVNATGNLNQSYGTAVDVSQVLGATNTLRVTGYSDPVTPGGQSPSNQSLLKIRIRRTAADGGALAAPALLTGLKFRHPISAT